LRCLVAVNFLSPRSIRFSVSPDRLLLIISSSSSSLSKKCYRIHKTGQKRSEDIRQELEISGIQDVRLKYKQNWINHLERMNNTRLPKYALNYKPRGRRDHGRPRK